MARTRERVRPTCGIEQRAPGPLRFRPLDFYHSSYWWSADGKRILWIQDRAGDENPYLFVASVTDTSSKALDLTPFKNVEVELLSLRRRRRIQ